MSAMSVRNSMDETALLPQPINMSGFCIHTYAKPPHSLCRPTGLVISPRGDFVVADYEAARVKVFNKMSQLIREYGRGVLKKPWNVALFQNSHMAVSDIQDGVVKLLYPDGQLMTTLATLKQSRALCTDSDDNLFIVDNGSLYMYNWTHKQLHRAQADGDRENGLKLTDAKYMCADHNGNVLITCADHRCAVAVNCSTGKELFRYQPCYEKSSSNRSPTEFTPTGICTDQMGHVLIADTDNHAIHLLTKSGNFIRYLLTAKDGLEFPEAIALDPQGNLVIAERESGEIKVYRYLS